MNDLREEVRARYAEAALTVLNNDGAASCCGPAGCGTADTDGSDTGASASALGALSDEFGGPIYAAGELD